MTTNINEIGYHHITLKFKSKRLEEKYQMKKKRPDSKLNKYFLWLFIIMISFYQILYQYVFDINIFSVSTYIHIGVIVLLIFFGTLQILGYDFQIISFSFVVNIVFTIIIELN